jgi:hypothetical protein
MKTVVLVMSFFLLFSFIVTAETLPDKDSLPIVTDSLTVKIDSLEKKAPAKVADRVIVYYFHGTRRCANCLKFEEYSKEAIDSGFAGELADGRLKWRMINTDESENKHYVNDYQLYTKSLVLARVVDGKEVAWKNLDKIWKLVGDKEKFIAYVQEEIKAYLKEN